MKRTRIIVLAVAGLVLVGALTLAVLRQRSRPQSRRGFTMGTIPFTITAVPGGGWSSPDGPLRSAHQAIEAVNAAMSDYRPDSDLSRLNAAEKGRTVQLAEPLMRVLLVARRHTDLTGNTFDPTGRPLFRLWKDAGKTDRRPSDAEIAAAKALTGWEKLTLDEKALTAVKSIDGLQIDLGAIAKGYAVDQAIERLAQAGMAGGMVEVGGEVRVFGPSPSGGKWVLGIQHPFRPTNEAGEPVLCGKVTLGEGALATSGDYQRSTEIQGETFSHIIDLRTGQPVAAVPSVTVIAPDCMTADIWATALSVLGPAGMERIDGIDGIEAMMIVGTAAEHEVFYSAHFRDSLADGTPIQLD